MPKPFNGKGGLSMCYLSNFVILSLSTIETCLRKFSYMYTEWIWTKSDILDVILFKVKGDN